MVWTGFDGNDRELFETTIAAWLPVPLLSPVAVIAFVLALAAVGWRRLRR